MATNILSSTFVKVQSSYNSLKQRPFLWLLMCAAGFFVNEVYQIGYNKAKFFLFPALDDTRIIIEEQGKNFQIVNDNLKQLEAKLSGESIEQLRALRESVSVAMKTSEVSSAKLERLADENAKLREERDQLRANSGDVFELKPGQGRPIDSSASIGFKDTINGRAYITITALDGISRGYVDPGQGLRYMNAAGKNCTAVFIGLNFEESAKISVHCEK